MPCILMTRRIIPYAAIGSQWILVVFTATEKLTFRKGRFLFDWMPNVGTFGDARAAATQGRRARAARKGGDARKMVMV